MRTFVIGLVALGATVAQGAIPRFGTTFDKRLTTNELGTVAQTGATMLPTAAFVDDGHGGWALDGAAFAEKGVALYADGTKGGWNATLTGNTNVTMVVDGEPKTVPDTEIASDWVLSLRAKVGDADDQILWYLRYGSAGVGVYLRTVRNEDGKLCLSLEWSGKGAWSSYANVVFSNVDTTGFHHYVVKCSQADGLAFLLDGETKWTGKTINAYDEEDPDNVFVQERKPYAKGYNSLWLGRVEGKTNVGAGDWTTVYDDVRFYSTNNASDSSVPTAEEIVALTETVKEDRVLVLPNARLAVSFDDRALQDAAGVIEQVGADVPAKSAFRLNNRGGYTLDAARLEDGKGACLYQFGDSWAEYQPLFGCHRETGRSFAISLVAKIAPVDGAAVCYVRYGNTGVGLVLYTVRNATGGTDLALAWLGSSSHIAYPNVVAANIDTMDYHHYVLACSADSKNTRPIRLWIDAFPVDLFTEKRLSYYEDEAATTTATRVVASKGYSGLYLAAARGAELACTAPNGTRFGDVRLFVGEEATDGYGSSAISPEDIDALYRKLMPYADRVLGGLILSFR